MKRPLALIILDGWGIGLRSESNPLHMARLPHMNDIARRFPTASLQASGISVGLPWGEVGTSEVGHLTIGAGRVIYQYLPRISMAIEDKSFFKNPALASVFRHAEKGNRTVHLVGLLTEGTVHASLAHLKALLRMAEGAKVQVKLHLFADGMDSSPKLALKLLTQIPRDKVATLTGRAYAMNHDENWPLTQKTYECLTKQGEASSEPLETALKNVYARNGSEAFLPPTRLLPHAGIAAGDGVIFFNFREDGMRQLARAFADPAFKEFPREQIANLAVATMTNYDERIKAKVAFPPEEVREPLGASVSKAGKNQIRIAETLKYAHITYFFNAYRETPFPNEYRVLIPSAHNPRLEEYPEMMASAIGDRAVESLQSGAFDFILVNYANADAIAHTGNFEACVAAAEVIDREVGRLILAAETAGAILLITSDHGNIETVINPRSGAAETQHNLNPVPLYLVGKEFEGKSFEGGDDPQEPLGILSDIAPTVLALMGIPAPAEMTGKSLLRYVR